MYIEVFGAFDSTGVLCGQCDGEDKGVSALLNECVSCSDASGLLILALSTYVETYQSCQTLQYDP